MAIKSEKLSFPGVNGQRLDARLDGPLTRPKAYALFAHCFTCSKEALAAARISTALAEQGIAVLRFDFTGLGGSDGDIANTSFSSNVEDLVAAAEHLSQHHEPPRILIGHSLGGSAVLAAAGRIADATAVATIGAPFDPAHVQRLFPAALETIRSQGQAEVHLGGRTFSISRGFLEDTEEQNMQQALAGLRKALLVLHSPQDEALGIDNASRIFLAARHPKSFVSLNDADHLLTRRADAVYVATVLAAWASRYVAEEAGALGQGPSVQAEPGVVTVAENGDGPYGQTINSSGHALRADEPQKNGGNDSGPSPYNLLLSALGACTAMTLRMYADRKQWPLEKVTVRLSHRKVHAEDCTDCETKEGRIDHIDRVIAVEGPLDDEQRRRLLEIADRCPVHRTLHSEVWVESRLGE